MAKKEEKSITLKDFSVDVVILKGTLGAEKIEVVMSPDVFELWKTSLAKDIEKIKKKRKKHV